MKVKELIELLQKQDQEDKIHIWVDDEVGCGAGEFEKYYASKIEVMGHTEYYKNEHNILNEEEIEEQARIDCEYNDEYEWESLICEEINSRIKLEGCWIKIQP
jgi:hypothetical protein